LNSIDPSVDSFGTSIFAITCKGLLVWDPDSFKLLLIFESDSDMLSSFCFVVRLSFSSLSEPSSSGFCSSCLCSSDDSPVLLSAGSTPLVR
jgi:hypothetical protein